MFNAFDDAEISSMLPPAKPEPVRMLRYNSGKPSLSLLPTSLIKLFDVNDTVLLTDTALVLDYGSRKYSANNWRKAGPWLEVLDCALRHTHKIFRGETHDDETGIHHGAHVACNLGFLLEFIDQGSGTDDRYTLSRIQTVSHNQGHPLESMYVHLLAWKDGAGHSRLTDAVHCLNEYYKALSPDERQLRPGSSPHAHISMEKK